MRWVIMGIVPTANDGKPYTVAEFQTNGQAEWWLEVLNKTKESVLSHHKVPLSEFQYPHYFIIAED